MMYWDVNGPQGWGFVLMVVGMVLFWGFLVLGVVAMMRYLRRGERPVVAAPNAQEILDERFARGEIDEPEYAQRLDVLAGAARSRS
jgi:putative membrane protein